jgi:aspartate/glutamate racemase
MSIKAILPTDDDQAILMRAIYSVKAGYLSVFPAVAIQIGRRMLEAEEGEGRNSATAGIWKIW